MTNQNQEKHEALIEAHRRTVVARGGVKQGDVGQGVQTFSCKMNKFQGPNIQHGDHSILY